MKVSNWLIGVIIGVVAGVSILGGMMIGMIIQQMIFTASAVEFGESLEGVTFNIEVDLNETIIVDRISEIWTPIFNQTIQEKNIMEKKQ